jgi:hypothetical protein
MLMAKSKIKDAVFVCCSNYGVKISVFDSENLMLSYVMTGSRNNLTKSLNQQGIKAAIQNYSSFKARVGNLQLEVRKLKINEPDPVK